MDMIYALCMIFTSLLIFINMHQNEDARNTNVIALASGMLVSGLLTALCTLAGIE